MKILRTISLVIAPVFLLITFLGVAQAQDHQTPVAPQEYLDMENPIDIDDVDEVYLKKIKRTYKSKCSKCHGSSGDGEGSASEDIVIKPTAFNAEGYMDSKSDGQLYWILEFGSEGTEMEGFGPESDAGMSEDRLWQLITYMRASFTE